jgi:hypothetical protein
MNDAARAPTRRAARAQTARGRFRPRVGMAMFIDDFLKQGGAMSTIHLHQRTTATPEQLLAALTDFGPGRSKLFGNSADEYLRVHARGPHEADVTEGSHGVWERLHYDWSDPNHVVMRTTDSNVWGGSSGHTYDFKRNADGTTDVDVVVVRDGKNFTGRVAGAFVGTVGKGQLARTLANTVKAVEARNVETRIS